MPIETTPRYCAPGHHQWTRRPLDSETPPTDECSRCPAVRPALTIPAAFPAGNDELRALGSPIRHYHVPDGWHLGIPTTGAFVPHLVSTLDYNRAELERELAREPLTASRPVTSFPTSEERYAAAVAHRRGERVSLGRRLAAWLDAPCSSKFPVPRLAIGLAILAVALYVYGASSIANT